MTNVAKQVSDLILLPERVAKIIQATKAGGLLVSVKTRFKKDIANLSIHLRTRKEMSKVDVHWELIVAIQEMRDEFAPNTLLTINGIDRKVLNLPINIALMT